MPEFDRILSLWDKKFYQIPFPKPLPSLRMKFLERCVDTAGTQQEGIFYKNTEWVKPSHFP